MNRRFKHLDRAFFPYLGKVMARIPEPARDAIMNNEAFQVIGEESPHVMGAFISFDYPISHLVFLHPELLKKPEYHILYIIAHELAHWISPSHSDGLKEKEAEDLLIQWGFREESEKVRYYRAHMESEGFHIGYEWGKRQTRGRLAQYEEYLDEWETGNWSEARLIELEESLNTVSICSAMQRDGLIVCPREAIINALPVDTAFWLGRGIAFGVLSYASELFSLNRSSRPAIRKLQV